MINRIIDFSIDNKRIVGLPTLALVGAGVWSMAQVPIDAVPDITFEQNPKALREHTEIENKGGNLIAGMYIKDRIQVGNNEVKALPVSASVKEGEKSFEFAVGNEGGAYRFVPHEVTLGVKDGDWAAVHFLRPLEANVAFAFNNAYYLMAEMKKGETEHSHR
ncbi:hypothetical protein Q4603_12725 [Zobellia galactanivorans]|uniref:hypothetical protein n=1 Tax=Zobellia galactanivorans (strain DSM 12802 / CCUG 47099 / CIP 106680 / NCIMB 13871 / Dsij) TaxID=63186 RepID=UPI0026E18019|nr:hypothetical protein [Zobellia galactanivorans]MDO6809485.1 hypothetical protein [Zobellia galactanivorans]